MLHKDRFGAITYADDRILRVVFSDESVDETGEVVTQAGIRVGPFLRNPMALLWHDPKMPCGTVSDISLSAIGSTCVIKLAPPEISPDVDTAWGLIKAGIVKSVSWGFDVLEAEPMDPARPRGPLRYLRTVMREVSIVSLPANMNAGVLEASAAKSAGSADRARRLARLAEVEKIGRQQRARELAAGNPAPLPARPDLSGLTRAARMAHAQAVAERGGQHVAPALPSAREAAVQRAASHARAVSAYAPMSREARIERAEHLARQSRPAGF